MSSGAAEPARVLVVDDERDLCLLLELRLRHHGFDVRTARTSSEALTLMEGYSTDVMIVDVRLENESGLDLLVEVQRRELDLPVIVLTAHGTVEIAVEAMSRGACAFLTKPFDDHELIDKLQQAAERVRLRREVATFPDVSRDGAASSGLIGAGAAIRSVREIISRIAESDATVLVLGESGTGKEVAARSIHAQSARAHAPLVAINCGALPASLLESELFGHTRGSFTGAVGDKAGLFAAASGGTLFLDEIGDAPAAVQVKLLRVLQERTYVPVGDTRPRKSDVRIIAATNRNLPADIDAGRFRDDLFYRLHVVPIVMPPLRERPEDIPLLAELFLVQRCRANTTAVPVLSAAAMELLVQHAWPGNVRELANVIEGAALLASEGVVRPQHLAAVMSRSMPEGAVSFSAEPPSARTLAAATIPGPRPSRSCGALAIGPPAPLREAREAFDRAYLEEVLRQCGGNVTAAAKIAGRARTDFHELLRRYGIDAAAFRS